MSRRYMTGAERMAWLGARHLLAIALRITLAFGVGRLTSRRRARTI